MKKEFWYMQRGLVKVTVKAQREEDESATTFDFLAYVEEEVSNYDMLDYINDVMMGLAHLRKVYRAEVVDVEKIEEGGAV